MLNIYKKQLDVGIGDNIVDITVYDNSFFKRKMHY